MTGMLQSRATTKSVAGCWRFSEISTLRSGNCDCSTKLKWESPNSHTLQANGTGGGSSPWPDGSPARPAASPCICYSAGPGQPSSVAPSLDCELFHFLPDGAVGDRPTHRTTERPRKLAPVRSASGSCRVLSCHLAHHIHCRPPSVPPKTPGTPLRRPHAVHPSPSVDLG